MARRCEDSVHARILSLTGHTRWIRLGRKPARSSVELRQKGIKLLHESHSSVESAKLVRGHRIGIEMHDIIPNESNFFKQRGKHASVDFQLQLCPDLRMLT
jgi:hypothetical protein